MRPLVHFTPPRNFMNDPNGLVALAGEYHLFYQHNPFGETWGHMSWGHAISRDLVRWDHLPVALGEDEGVMIFSGCAVVDQRNTSGFGDGLTPPLVAIYTGHSETEQTQNIAYSRDLGRTWAKYTGNPVIAIGSREHRDPKVTWHAPTQRWIMVTVLADLHKVRFDGSPDLLHWEHLSDFGPFGAADGVWECPDLFPLPIEGRPDATVWVLKVDVCRTVGAQVAFGHFDGRRFELLPGADIQRVDYGVDFYAAQSWSDTPDGRRIWLAWMSNWHYANATPTVGWRGVCSIPREVALCETDAGLRLVQRPIAELRSLRGAQLQINAGDLDDANVALAALDPLPALELTARLSPAGARRLGLRIDHGDGQVTLIAYDVVAGSLAVDRRRSGEVDFSEHFPAVHTAPLMLDDRPLTLQVFVDTCTLEVFAQDGAVALSDLIFPRGGLHSISLFGDGGDPIVESLSLWPLDAAR